MAVTLDDAAGGDHACPTRLNKDVLRSASAPSSIHAPIELRGDSCLHLFEPSNYELFSNNMIVGTRKQRTAVVVDDGLV